MDGWHFTPFSPLAIQGRLHGHGGQFWICKKWWLITWLVFTSYPNSLLRLSLISWNSSTISNLLHQNSITPLFTIHRCTFSFFLYDTFTSEIVLPTHWVVRFPPWLASLYQGGDLPANELEFPQSENNLPCILFFFPSDQNECVSSQINTNPQQK